MPFWIIISYQEGEDDDVYEDEDGDDNEAEGPDKDMYEDEDVRMFPGRP